MGLDLRGKYRFWGGEAGGGASRPRGRVRRGRVGRPRGGGDRIGNRRPRPAGQALAALAGVLRLADAPGVSSAGRRGNPTVRAEGQRSSRPDNFVLSWPNRRSRSKREPGSERSRLEACWRLHQGIRTEEAPRARTLRSLVVIRAALYSHVAVVANRPKERSIRQSTESPSRHALPWNVLTRGMSKPRERSCQVSSATRCQEPRKRRITDTRSDV